MKRFSPFFLLMGGLALSLHAKAQASPPIIAASARLPIHSLAVAAPHSSQLPQEELAPAPAPTSSAAPEASRSQLLLVLLETIQAQQVQLNALQAQASAATRRANQAEAATIAFEQRLRQLEAAGGRPSLWR